MVKHGPCYHCGIDKTPLWRNGPPEKPVLCNACGSRWRIRGTLEDYVPKHALAAMNKPAAAARPNKSTQHNELSPTPDKILVPTAHPSCTVEAHSDTVSDHDAATYSTGVGDDTSHRSSSSGSSSISCSSTDHSHSTEPLSRVHCSNNWNSNIPSRKRSRVQYQNLTFVEKLQKDLYDILQSEETSTVSECPDGNLIYYENGGNIIDPEIGLGVLLLEPPTTPAQKEPKRLRSDEGNTS